MNTPLSLRILDAFAALPPLRPANVLPVVLMLSLWTAFVHAGGRPERAFVTIMVLGQSFAFWRNLPRAAFALRQPERDRREMLIWPVAGMLGLAAIQLWVCDPLFSQRLFSAGCLFLLVIMVLGMRREKELLARVGAELNVQRVPLLRINALVAALTLIVNEMLISAGDLTVWITGMAVYALVVHAVYWFMVLLVLPAEDSQA